MGLVILIAEEGDGVVFALGLGLLLQLAIDPITKSEKIRWGRRGIRMSLEMYLSVLVLCPLLRGMHRP